MDIKSIIEATGMVFELAGVGLLTTGSLIAGVKYGAALIRRSDLSGAYQALRRDLGKTILLGLEVLVVADIIRSVAVDPSFASLSLLGLLVVIRTFLSWSLEVEINGEWPWQRGRSASPGNVPPHVSDL
jgi:uncharacterized membrane protein